MAGAESRRPDQYLEVGLRQGVGDTVEDVAVEGVPDVVQQQSDREAAAPHAPRGRMRAVAEIGYGRLDAFGHLGTDAVGVPQHLRHRGGRDASMPGHIADGDPPDGNLWLHQAPSR